MYGKVEKLFLDANKTPVMSTVKRSTQKCRCERVNETMCSRPTTQRVRGDSRYEDVLQLTNLVLVYNTILVFVHIFCYIG